MSLLDKTELLSSLGSSDPDSLFIDPLLDRDQVGSVTIDFRLGYDFLVSILTRRPSISLWEKDHQERRGISTYFQETRRDLGDLFVLYPNQIVLATTLEYLTLPSTMSADIFARSSYSRLGIHVNSIVQPGFRGCVPLELFNHGTSPVELRVGCRLCQARLFRPSAPTQYLDSQRKYFGVIRPTVSRADHDNELSRITAWRKHLNRDG